MSPGAKIFLTLAGVGAVIGVIAVAAKPASAAPGQPPQPKPSDAPPDVIVPPPGQNQPVPPPGASLPTFPPLFPSAPAPPAQPQPQPQPAPFPAMPVLPSLPTMPPGVTVALPNPLGGPPLGTYDPATGNVFGPGGVIIGTFNPQTGIFTATTGQQVQIPGFGPSVPAPVVPSIPVLPPPAIVPSGPVLPAPPAAPSAPAPVTTVPADTAAMVQALLTAEQSSGWNVTDPAVQLWQQNRGLTADGKFGPATALKTATEIGTVPLIRFWPLGTAKATLLQNYQAGLLSLAQQASDPNKAQELRASASREQAQAFSVKGKIAAVPVANQIQIGRV